MIHHDQLIDLTKIGRGEFGEVLVGDIVDSDLPSVKHQQINREGEDAASVKKMQNGTDEIEAQKRVNLLVKSMSKIKDEAFFVEFRRQIDLYRAVDSLNVVKLLALCFEKEHHFMILENGQDLRAFLVENSDISVHQILNYCRQIVCAVEAIAKSKLTHR
jgi:serine/threonine protein kinase